MKIMRMFVPSLLWPFLRLSSQVGTNARAELAQIRLGKELAPRCA